MDSSEKKAGKRNSIFFKVYANYAVLVLIFAVMLGLTFMKLYQDSNSEDYSKQLQKKAERVAERFRNYIVDEDFSECLSYLEILREFDETEIWTLSNPLAEEPMQDIMVSVSLEDVELQEEYHEIINEAFHGKTYLLTFFSDIHDATTVAVGTPIVGGNREVCGALVLITTMESMDRLTHNITYLILVSIVVALVASFMLAVAFARQISRPISKMRTTALELADGNYSISTDITSNDEVGDLARTIDFLSEKLQATDIERRNMEQARLDFFANVSHELRTPIAVVRAYAESLVDGIVTDEAKIQQYYERMLIECKSMERLVGDLLTLSKMQNPDFVVEKEPVNVVHIFDDIARTVNTLGQEKGVKLKIEKNNDVIMMMGDYDRLRQMFLVICDNAVKFSRENSYIYITLTLGEKIRVSIRDEGVGIAQDELPNIFEKFYKSKLRQNAKGTGLGLAIAKQIALKHGGTINVISELTKGTEFIFEFKPVFEDEF